ncbi:hypothetical protein SCLCIDRAFT_1209264 [Scleroderma citrinum Foug A]|uniref:Cytochrome P450 n=1 Tax=Scleroderma citrinum Foug A TaxID=1036808 RepID=A0A0C3A453_9AGAM|nr:hypothetical protein SCLCIDRAFT_1209264 [Scleroderma citrinum Foug A]
MGRTIWFAPSILLGCPQHNANVPPGGIVYTCIFSQDFVIINSTKIARHLADQRSIVYSDQPQSPLYKLFGIDHMTFLLRYCDEWRVQRKLLHPSLKPEVIDQYQELYTRNTSQLLQNLHQSPSKFREHLHLYGGSISLEMVYGRRIKGKNNPIISLATGLGDILSKETTPEKSSLLMAFPFLQYLPSWFPGFGLKHHAKASRKLVHTLSDVLYCMAKQQMESGTLPQCLVYDFLTNNGNVEEKSAKDAASGIYLESTATVLEILIMAMILFPDVQENTHEELDTMLGKGVVPTFTDRERLPYLQAVIYKLMRWHTIFPSGVPHMTSMSDIYEGYYIPKGCIVIFNIWVCPGRYFAENVLWAAIGMMLSSFTFKRAKDVNGNYIDIEPRFEHGQSSHPLSFECVIIRR